MLFSSLVFLFYFFPCVLVIYYLLSFSIKLQNVFLLAASLFFYAWGEPKYVFLMLLSVLINYILGLLISYYRGKQGCKTLLAVAVFLNLLLLFFFKYFGFVARNINFLLDREALPILSTALPIGISFFTFQAMSYVIDVYRRDATAERNILNVGLYIAFFPQLIAGPIVRYNCIAKQIQGRRTTRVSFCVGCNRFVIGLIKKILLSNNFAIVADSIYRMSGDGGKDIGIPVLLAWMGAAAYMLQIFFDFSGYSDMAIGLGLMFGFRFEENFNYPYIAKSVGEFWRRWHISLSTWFREYVYFPMGGSRVKNQDDMVRNLLVVWLLTGIWHGAEWNFLLWGFFNFAFILIERFFDFENNKVPNCVKHGYLILVVLMGWVLFRAPNLPAAFAYYKNMFGLMGNNFFSEQALMFLREYGACFLMGILFSTPAAKKMETNIMQARSSLWGTAAGIFYVPVLLLLFMVSVTYLVRGSYNPFIYFNF